MDFEKRVLEKLSSLDEKRKGFKYLVDAITIFSSKRGNLPLYKQVFPVIAKKYNVTSQSVERDIRYVLRNQNCSTKNYLKKIIEDV